MWCMLVSHSVSSVAQSCPTLCNPMNRSTPGLPVHHQLPKFTQTHVHWVGDAIQPSHPLSSPSPPAPNPSQHQSFPVSQLFVWGGQSTGVSALASFLPKRSQGQSPLGWTGWISLQSKGLWCTYILLNNRQNKLTFTTLYGYKFLPLVMITFKISSFRNFQIYNAVLVNYSHHAVCYIPQLIHLVTGNVYFWLSLPISATLYLWPPRTCLLYPWDFFFKDSAYKWVHTVFVSLISFSIMSSRPTHPWCYKGQDFLPFLWLNNILVCVYLSHIFFFKKNFCFGGVVD